LSPVEGIDDIVLIADMPRVLPDEAAELNATQKNRENKQNRENADANFTSSRRNYCTAQERLCDHSPKNDKTKLDSTVSNSLCSKLCLV
jgi:hypothetical protein